MKFLQIWVFPNQKNVQPRYDQISLKEANLKNRFSQILSPNPEDEGVWIYQDAWFHMAELDQGHQDTYTVKRKGNGVYFFVLEGDVTIGGQPLNKRDGYGIWDTETVKITADSNARILAMDVPMSLG